MVAFAGGTLGRRGRMPGMTPAGGASIRERIEKELIRSSGAGAGFTIAGGPGLSFLLADGVRNVQARSLHFTEAVHNAAQERPSEAIEVFIEGLRRFAAISSREERTEILRRGFVLGELSTRGGPKPVYVCRTQLATKLKVTFDAGAVLRGTVQALCIRLQEARFAFNRYARRHGDEGDLLACEVELAHDMLEEEAFALLHVLRERKAKGPLGMESARVVDLPHHSGEDKADALQRTEAGTVTTPAHEDSAEVLELKQQAAAGVPSAMMRLAALYENGNGVEADPITADRWRRRGMARATFHLGLSLLQGRGVRIDYDNAFKQLKEAADGIGPG